MKSDFYNLGSSQPSQRGINMVDLMMWLVIAAMLLATALQGIGYYQQGAYTYQAKEEATAVASRIVAEASMDNGIISTVLMQDVVDEHNAENSGDEIEVYVDTLSLVASNVLDGSPLGMERVSSTTSVPQYSSSSDRDFLKVIHGGMTDREVVYFFKDVRGYSTGVHVLNKNTVGNPIEEPSNEGSPTPEPTLEPEPALKESPADSNTPGATIIQYSAQAGQFTNRSVTETTSETLRFSFSIENATDANNYKTEWFPFGSGAEDITVAPGSGTTTALHWYGDVTPAKGYVSGEVNVTAKVTNLTTSEVSYKTWIITVGSMAAAEPAGLSSQRAVWSDRSVPSNTSGMVRFGFDVKNVTPSQYEVTWSGGENIGATLTPNYRSDAYGRAWQVDVNPPNGFVEGTGTITATLKHIASGTSVSKSWTLTVTPVAITEPAGLSSQRAVWSDKSVPSNTSEMVRFGFDIKNAQQSEYEVTWSGGENIGSTLTPNYRSDAYGRAWQVDVTPPSGFVEGTGTITATAKHLPTGRVVTKTWTLAVTPVAMTSPAGLSAHTAVWSNKSVPSNTSGMIRFGFDIKNAQQSEYEVTWSGGENIGSTLTPNYRSDAYGRAWQVDVTPPSGFVEGAGSIVATAKHLPTGKIVTKTWTLTVTPVAMTAPAGLSAHTAVWSNKTANVGSTSKIVIGFDIKNAQQSEYEVTWQGSESLNSTLLPNYRSDSYGRAWQVDITPQTGLVGGTHTVTGSAKHLPTGKVVTKTWTITVP